MATWITRGIPGPLRYRLADLGGGAAFTIFGGRARVAQENYRVFRPGDARAVHRLARDAFRNYARTVMDFLVLERLLAGLKATPGAVEMTPLRQALALGRPVIVVTPHLGNWDLGAAIIASAGRPVYAVADQFGPPAVDSLVRATRERLGVRVIPTGPASAREALRALRRGDVLCLAADIDKAGRGIPVNFLGRRVCLPAGPATLALRTGASLIPGYALRRPQGGHEARLFDPIELPEDGDAEDRKSVV
jgi:KDO2-lipid IV(A) lauroyltransferase